MDTIQAQAQARRKHAPLRRRVGNLRRRRKGRIGRHWHVDETYIKVAGRWCCVYRAIDGTGALVDVLFREHRDMKAARAFFRSAQAVTGVTPKRVTTDGHDSYPRAIRTRTCAIAPATTEITGWNRTTAAWKADTGPCAASKAPDRRPSSVADTMNSATTFALDPIIINPFLPRAADYRSSAEPRPCWPSWKPRDRVTTAAQRGLYSLAQVLTEPPRLFG
jgi:hypothetical protein